MTIPHAIPPEWPTIAADRFAAAIGRWHAGARPAPGTPAIGLLGLADDTGVAMNNGRVGARDGPRALRAALAKYGVAAPMDGAPMPAVIDCGDVEPGATLDETHQRVTAAAAAILDAGLFPLAIGGGHDLTFAFARATVERRAVKTAVYLDPHLDVRERPGSGMPFRALVERCGIASLLNIGAEPLANSREHFDWFTAHGGQTRRPDGDPASWLPAELCIASLDLDAIDASQMPGVSAINPAGVSVQTAAAFAFAAGRSASVACFDVMELNPAFDPDGRSARAAAYCVLSFLRGFALRVRAGVLP